MTLGRKSERMLARWKNVHIGEAEWQVPEENSWAGKPHVVSLSQQAVQLF